MLSRVHYYRLFHTLSDQYSSVDIACLLRSSDLSVKVSRKTGRITQVLVGEDLMLSLRTSDGRYLPTYGGALWLLGCGLSDRRIVVHSAAAPFVSEGKSLFTKHIVSVSSDIHAGDECFLFDSVGNLLAVGSSVHPSYALLDLVSGVGVKVKHYNKA